MEINKETRKQMLVNEMKNEKKNFILELEIIKDKIENMFLYEIDEMPYDYMDEFIDHMFDVKRAYSNYKERHFELACINYEEEESEEE